MDCLFQIPYKKSNLNQWAFLLQANDVLIIVVLGCIHEMVSHFMRGKQSYVGEN